MQIDSKAQTMESVVLKLTLEVTLESVFVLRLVHADKLTCTRLPSVATQSRNRGNQLVTH